MEMERSTKEFVGGWVSCHAQRRMRGRGIGLDRLEALFEHGRIVFTRGAIIYAIGRKEVDAARRKGLDLRELEGLQLVVVHGLAVTAYRNRDFRGLTWRARRRRGAA